MPTPCLRFHWLRWHRVSVFNNHVRMVNESADIMSALVNSYFSLCLYSQWLRRHTIFENIKLHFLLLFCLFILSGAEVEFCDKKVSKISWHCPLNQKIILREKSDEFVQPHGPKKRYSLFVWQICRKKNVQDIRSRSYEYTYNIYQRYHKQAN